MTQCLDVTVTYSSGTYTTQTVNRQRASSTCSADTAAHRLGEKVFGEALIGVHHLRRQEGDEASVTRWRLVATTEG